MSVRIARRVVAAAIIALVLLILSLSPVFAAKNMIIMIGDGMGFKQVEATRNYKGTPLVMESLPVKLAASTYMYGGSYNPSSAATSFSYLNGGATDSAAAATALATGTKVDGGNISTDHNDINRLKNMTEHARLFNRAVGVISTVPFSHATPAGFAAHNIKRENVAAIAREMITSLGDGSGARGNTPTCEVVIGGGQGTGYIGANEYNALKNGTTGQGWTFVEKTTGVNGGIALLNASQTATKLFGLFGGGHDGDFPYRMANNSGQTLENPTLAQMSTAAINVLSKDPDGFFLMVEGGMIDHAGHSNLINEMIGETLGFDEAVASVMNWVNANDPTWSDTLLIVTADHETGYLTRGSGMLANVALGNPGAGVIPATDVHYRWNSGSHTNSLVPVYAKGAGSEMLTAYAAAYDTLYSKNYLDNTDIFKVMYSAVMNKMALSEARSAPHGETLALVDVVVTASFSDAFWVESTDRSSGLKIISTTRPAVGKKVTIVGNVVKANNEVAMQAINVTIGNSGIVPYPVAITGKTAAEFDKDGASAQGLMVKVAGNVTGVTTDTATGNVNGYFLDDGSGIAGDGLHLGLYVIVDPARATSPEIVNSFITNAGPLTTAAVGGNLIPAVRAVLQVPVDTFTAYNDCAYVMGEPANNITTYSLGASGVYLMDYNTGLYLPVTVDMRTFSNIAVGVASGSNCYSGTDVYNVFYGKVGLVGVINYTAELPAPYYMEIVFGGLNPNSRYEFVTTANRANSSYTTRLTKFIISGVQGFTNESTPGATFSGPTDPTVTFCTGYNTAKGHVARWANIQPAANGTFKVRAENLPSDIRSYMFSAFMLKKTM